MSHPHGTALLERKLIEEERKLSKLLEEICEKHDVNIMDAIGSNQGKTRRRAASSDMPPMVNLSTAEARSLSPIFRRSSDLNGSPEEKKETISNASSNKELQTLLKQNALDVAEMLKKKDDTIEGLKNQINELENTIIRFIQYKNSVASSAQLLTTTVTKTLNSAISPSSAQQKCSIALKDKEFILKMNALLTKQVQQSVVVPASVTKRLSQIQKEYSSTFGANKTAFIDVYSVPRSPQPAIYPVQPLQIMSTTTEGILNQLFDLLVQRQTSLNHNNTSSGSSSSSTTVGTNSSSSADKKAVWIDKRIFVMFCLVACLCEESKLNLAMILKFYDENTTPVLLKTSAEYEQLMNYQGFVNAMNSVGSVKATKGKVLTAPLISGAASATTSVSDIKTLTSSMNVASLVSSPAITTPPLAAAAPTAPTATPSVSRPPPPTPPSGFSVAAGAASGRPPPPPPGPPATPPSGGVNKIGSINSSSISAPVRPPPSTPPPPSKMSSTSGTAASAVATTTASKPLANVISTAVSPGLTGLVDNTLRFLLGDMIENSAAIDLFVDLFLPVSREEVIGLFAKHQSIYHPAYGRSKSYGLMEGKKISASVGSAKKKTVGSSPVKSKVQTASQQDTSNYSNFEVFCCNFDIVPHLCSVSVARRISQYVSYATVTEDFSYLLACIYYLAVYLTDAADWGIPLTNNSSSGASGSRQSSRMRAVEEVEAEEERARLTGAQRQQVHFQTVLENIEKIIWSIEASSH